MQSFLVSAEIPTPFRETNYHHLQPLHDLYSYLPLASTSFDISSNDTPLDATLYHHALAILQQRERVQRLADTTHHTGIDVNTSTPAPLPRHFPPTTSTGESHHQGAVNIAPCDWQMYATPYISMGGPVAGHSKGVKRTRSHQRTPSASTIASNGPASPFMHSSVHPQIANVDRDPHSLGPYVDQPFFSKNLPTPSQTPTDSVFTNYQYTTDQHNNLLSAPMAMKGFAVDSNTSDDCPPEFAPSRQSMSSYGNNSPATPQSGAGDMDMRSYATPAHDLRQSQPNVQLFRTESQAYQDELYNPNAVYATTTSASKPNHGLLSPHRNQLTERLQTANLARSASPASAVSRERSPFVDGSTHSREWNPSIPMTAAQLRRQQEQATQSDFSYPPRLRREPTKTVSPKETFLDCNDPDQPTLFQDTIPAGYKAHSAGTEQWPSTQFLGQQGASYGNLHATNDQSNLGFRNNATSADYAVADFDFSAMLPPADISNNQYHANYQAAVQPKMNGFTSIPDNTPDFPAHLPSMETSISDVGPAPSSQETDATSSPRRPEDTRANTGTYTCTYHGCTQRFDTHNALQRHKRDFHRSQQQQQQQQQQQRDGYSMSAAGSTSPRSTESPAPSSTGMTSAAILARNSQAGPHKCTRINPSTNKPCNTVFSRPYDLTRHEDTIHNNRKQKVRCPMCREEKTFSRNDALTRHMRVVHPEVETYGKRGRRSD